MESNPSLVAYCGLHCGDCHGFDGRIPDLARDLRKELRKHRYDKFAEFISQYSFGKDFKVMRIVIGFLVLWLGFVAGRVVRVGVVLHPAK